jgi:hypothetical protein
MYARKDRGLNNTILADSWESRVREVAHLEAHANLRRHISQNLLGTPHPGPGSSMARCLLVDLTLVV